MKRERGRRKGREGMEEGRVYRERRKSISEVSHFSLGFQDIAKFSYFFFPLTLYQLLTPP